MQQGYSLGQWSDGLAEWTDGDTAYLSIAFSWRLNDAFMRAQFYRALGFKVRAGGPGIFTRKHYLADVAEIGGEIPDAVARHNPMATFASRGCPVACWFCIVPKMEGRNFTFIEDFPVRPVLCDNNLSALPSEYQDHIVKRYQKAEVPLLDANSGFEPATFTEEVYRRWKPINRGVWRFAFDTSNERDEVRRCMAMLKDEPAKKKRVYVLIGNEPKEECLARIYDVLAWGGEPWVQPFIKLNALDKKPHVRHDWTDWELSAVQRWINGHGFRKCPDFREFRVQMKNSARDPHTGELALFTPSLSSEGK